jgi:hypothetical protein
MDKKDREKGNGGRYEKILNCLLLDDNTILIGLEDIADILKCSTKYVSKLIREHYLPAAFIDGKYYTVKNLVVNWIVQNVGNTKIDSDSILKNLTKTP